MEKRRSYIGIITQVAVFFALAIAAAGIITYFSQYALSERAVKRQMEAVAANTADEFVSSVKEYPSYEWLLRYWYAHGDEMDIEYDAPFGPGTETEAKVRLFSERHPEIQIRYATTQEVAALPKADRKLYAEIVYSWVTTRIDEIKKAGYKVTTPMIITNTDDYAKVAPMATGEVKAGQDLLKLEG